MNWLRSKLRAWLGIEKTHLRLLHQIESLSELKRNLLLCFDLNNESQKQTEQQREICALRGEVAMLKRQVTMQSLPSWTTRFDEQGQRVWADGAMQEVERLARKIADEVKFAPIASGTGRYDFDPMQDRVIKISHE